MSFCGRRKNGCFLVKEKPGRDDLSVEKIDAKKVQHSKDNRVEKYQILKSDALGVTVLFGVVSNTLRDMMSNAHGLVAREPYVIVLPPVLFDGKRSFGEFEFLLYYNAFFLGNIYKSDGCRVRVVGTMAQLVALKELLVRTIFGPDWDSPSTLR